MYRWEVTIGVVLSCLGWRDRLFRVIGGGRKGEEVISVAPVLGVLSKKGIGSCDV